MEKHAVARQFEEKTESRIWTRRSLLSWLGKGCVLALGSRGVSGCINPTNLSGSDQWSRCKPEGFEFKPGDCDVSDWGERTVDPQVLNDILASWKLSVGGLVQNELSLTFDHRILDGAIADYFLAMIKQTLEEWA